MKYMVGYNKEEALAFVLRHINRREHASLAGQIEFLVSQAIDADFAYMHRMDVLDEEGYAGEGDYYDDTALECIVEDLALANNLDPDQAVKMASLVADYMDLHEAYLRNQGLVQDDEG